jgi:L-rhamnose-H+ transport protein
MTGELALGVAAVLFGGLLNGSFVAPMKRLRRWQWENSWLVYSLTGLLIIPWIVAPLAVPDLGGVLAGASWQTILAVILFGLGWGLGSVLFGLGVQRMGLAVGYGLILGLIAPIGTFLPLVVLHPERLFTAQGRALMIGTAIVLAGIFLCARAGRIREAGAPVQHESSRRGSFFSGLLICIFAGIFSPMLNFSFIFGKELQDRALSAGANVVLASNAIWVLTLTAGCLVNAGYCVFLLNKNHTWRLFRSGGPGHWIGGAAMGLICFGSFMIYGFGATVLGPLGGIVGWPLFMSMSLITSNLLGAASGEWAGAPRRAWGLSVAGMALLIVAIAIIARGGQG